MRVALRRLVAIRSGFVTCGSARCDGAMDPSGCTRRRLRRPPAWARPHRPARRLRAGSGSSPAPCAQGVPAPRAPRGVRRGAWGRDAARTLHVRGPRGRRRRAAQPLVRGDTVEARQLGRALRGDHGSPCRGPRSQGDPLAPQPRAARPRRHARVRHPGDQPGPNAVGHRSPGLRSATEAPGAQGAGRGIGQRRGDRRALGALERPSRGQAPGAARRRRPGADRERGRGRRARAPPARGHRATRGQRAARRQRHAVSPGHALAGRATRSSRSTAGGTMVALPRSWTRIARRTSRLPANGCCGRPPSRRRTIRSSSSEDWWPQARPTLTRSHD